MPKTTRLVTETVHLDPDLSEAIDVMAGVHQIPREQLIRRLLREHMEALGALDYPPELAEDTPTAGEA